MALSTQFLGKEPLPPFKTESVLEIITHGLNSNHQGPPNHGLTAEGRLVLDLLNLNSYWHSWVTVIWIQMTPIC